MSIPPPDDPTQPTRPLPPAQPPRVVERERVVDQVVEPEFDPRYALASLDDSVRSLRTGLVLLGLVSVAALALGLYALLRAEDDRSGRGGDYNAAEVTRLEDRVDELEGDLRRRTRGTADSGDVNEVQEALDAKADEKDVAEIQQAIADLQEAQGQQQQQPAEADPQTAQAIEDLSTRLDELEQRVEAQEQQAP